MNALLAYLPLLFPARQLPGWAGKQPGYKPLGKKALVKRGRYAHAKQYKRARREVKNLKTYLGRVTRDIQRKVDNWDPGFMIRAGMKMIGGE